MKIYTVGFVKKSAGEFFEILRRSGIRRLIDIRLNNTSQLAGFAKRDDLRYFLGEICGIEYHHEPLLCPTAKILDGYRGKSMDWDQYADRFLTLLDERELSTRLDRRLFDVPAVLLCSESTADKCHRRLAAEYLAACWDDVEIVHL